MESKNQREIDEGEDPKPTDVEASEMEMGSVSAKDVDCTIPMCSHDSFIEADGEDRVGPLISASADSIIGNSPNFHAKPITTSRFRRENSVMSRASVDSQGNAYDEATSQIRVLAKELFKAWDVTKSNSITLDEIIEGGLDEDFAAALLRTVDISGYGSISVSDLQQCLLLLKLGSMRDKVRLMVRFLDRNGDGKISYSEMQLYISSAPAELARKLGISQELSLTTAALETTVDAVGDAAAAKAPATAAEEENYFSLAQLVNVFENHDRGEEAIGVFCGHIITTLESRQRVSYRRQSRARSLYNMLQPAEHDDFDEDHEPQMCNAYNVFHILYVAVRGIPKQQMFITALVLLQIALWIFYFMYHYNLGFPIPFCIAKGFGLNLRILSIFLFGSMARTTMGIVFNYPVLKWLVPMGFNIQVHSFCGFCTVLHAMGHMSGHIAFHHVYVTGGFAHSFQQNSLLRGASWSEHGRGDAISGFVLLLSLLLMAASALFRSKSSATYERFSLTHYLYNIWLLFLFLHVPHLWKYFLITGAIFYGERFFDRSQQTHTDTLSTSRPCSNGVTFLSVPRHGDPTYPGSYYRIKVPAIAPLEWHPFSLAGSAASHHLTFFCASSGDWTKELYKIVSNPQLRDATTVLVQGPFYAPAHTAAVLNPTMRTLLVASGIGITPFFSIMATKVSDEQSYETDEDVYAALFDEDLEDPRTAPHSAAAAGSQAKKVANRMLKSVGISNRFGNDCSDGGEFERVSHGSVVFDESARQETEMRQVQMLQVVWTIRDPKELMFYLDYVYELVKHQNSMKQPAVQVDVYLTGLGKGTDLNFMIKRTFFLLSIAKRTSAYMNIFFGRPDMERIIGDIKPHNVYYCGGKFLKDTLADICIRREIPFHPEDFDSGASIAPDTIDRLKKLTVRKKPAAATAGGGSAKKH